MGLIQNFSVIPDPPAHATPPETSSLETLPSSSESNANPVGLAQVEWPVPRVIPKTNRAIRAGST